ncbi:C6 transcription factor [Phaeosphaeria sp. MPI-PUGE-AT-0046c]|nr:C6 transcription factor [Phaeosphaeria sp. MPI-PUGE-AT-0046c]
MIELSTNIIKPTHTKRLPINRVALACVQCRSRKVKCDATLPHCIRCQADGKTCEYQKSRRGGKIKRAVNTTLPPSEKAVTTLDDEVQRTPSWTELSRNAAGTYSSGPDSSGRGSIGSSTQSITDTTDSVSPLSNMTRYSTCLDPSEIDQLLSSYYLFFHVAHPCVLPRWSLNARLASEPDAAEILLPVILFIGSIFTKAIDSEPLAKTAQDAITFAQSRSGPPSPFYLQAQLLYAIAVYASNEPERGRRLLTEVITGALKMGMQRKQFAFEHGQGDPVLEESWRRTWWMIYITDAHIAGSTHTYPTRTGAAQTTTDLPCEEQQYEAGNIPVPATFRSYSVREFSDAEFSSFAQLIGLSQSVNRVLSTPQAGDDENAKVTAEGIDTAMTAWCSLLPPSKRRLLRDDGTVDELLFKANILMQTYIVCVHRRLSRLKHFPIETLSQCVAPPPPEHNETMVDEAHIHTAKVLFAVDKLNNLLTLPTRFTSHTPFIICMITIITIAQLSACRYIFKEPRLSLERDKIRLNMGVLKMMGEVWAAGKRESVALGTIAHEILALREDEIEEPQIVDVVPLDAMDFNFDFDVDWGCDSFANVGALDFVMDGIVA